MLYYRKIQKPCLENSCVIDNDRDSIVTVSCCVNVSVFILYTVYISCNTNCLHKVLFHIKPTNKIEQ